MKVPAVFCHVPVKCPVILYSAPPKDYPRCMKKWEYATVPLMIHATKQILDSWGEDGWELVTVLPGASAPSGPNPAGNMVAPTQGNPIAYFKREKAQ